MPTLNLHALASTATASAPLEQSDVDGVIIPLPDESDDEGLCDKGPAEEKVEKRSRWERKQEARRRDALRESVAFVPLQR